MTVFKKYAFRGLTENGALFRLEHFVAVVPQLDSALLERVYNLVFQKKELNFEGFVKALHNVLCLRPKRARLGMIFMVLVGGETKRSRQKEDLIFVYNRSYG